MYDATTNTILSKPSGATLSNLVGHVVEALTTNNNNGQGSGNCPPFPLATANIESDEWFSYDKDGRMTDMWEWTAVGQTYYHTIVVYDGDGVVTSMSGYPNNPTVSYTTDGEDRWNIAKLGATTLVNGVTYDAASRPTQINIGTGTDKDTYSYDNVGNMTQYQFFVGSQNNKGTLTWNPIGSLGSLAITDGFNINNSQTCNYAYDDVARLVTDNCGSVWSQTFGYDQYDNLWQSGSSSFACSICYNTSNNQYQTLGTTYDSNGNLTKDPAGNTFVYNVYGQLATINGGQEIVYDAFGREVANPSGTQSTEKLYSPMGFIGTLISSGPSNSVIKLPGGGTLNSDGAGGVYYSHMDWLGSARTQSAVSGGLTDDRSFAPYGEVYQTTNQDNPFLFAGTTSFLLYGTLYDTPNRELSAVAGRWNSPDPAHASWNAYSYPTDPNRQTDPTGLDGSEQSPCSGSGNCELSNDHITSLMGLFFTADSTKYGTDGRPAPWLLASADPSFLSDSDGAQNTCPVDACVTAPAPKKSQPKKSFFGRLARLFGGAVFGIVRWGKLGGPLHREGVARVAKSLKESGFEVQKEVRIPTPNGAKSSRWVDVVGTRGSETRMYQIGRQNLDGTPVAREVQALDDIEGATGIRPNFLPYNIGDPNFGVPGAPDIAPGDGIAPGEGEVPAEPEIIPE